MLTRIRPRPLGTLVRRDLPGPVDVINLLSISSFRPYTWYGLFVAPTLALVGARVRWMGRLDRAVVGEAQADKLLIVRYPSHRHFLAMTLNPYYLVINRLREAGVRRFEASFTHASHTDGDLAHRRTLVGVHYTAGTLDAVRALAEPVAGELVYATSTVADLDFLEPPMPSDPNPLRLRSLAMFAAGESLDDEALRALGDALSGVTDDCAVGVYLREPRAAYRPSLR